MKRHKWLNEYAFEDDWRIFRTCEICGVQEQGRPRGEGETGRSFQLRYKRLHVGFRDTQGVCAAILSENERFSRYAAEAEAEATSGPVLQESDHAND